MAVNRYNITIQNESNVARRFLLFQDVPIPNNMNQADVFTNVYQRSPRIESGNNSNVRFQTTNEFFAIYGTATKDSGDNSVRVYTSASVPVKLGPDGGYAALTTIGKNGDDPAWDKQAMKDRSTPSPGAFTLATDDSFTYPNTNNIYIGTGAKDPNSSAIIPVQTFLAEPSMTNILFPKVSYYICFGEYQPGMIVDRKSIGNVLKVDFTGCTLNDAIFTLNSKGQYEADKSVERNGIKWEYGRLL